MRPAVGGATNPAFAALGDDPAKVFERLQRLGSDYLKMGAIKPGAVVLAEDAAARGDAKPPLIAAQPYGAGRVVLVAPQDTWRLAVGAPDELGATSARMWAGLVAWAAAGADPPLSLRVAGARVGAGEPLRAELAVRTPEFEPVRTAHIASRCELVTPDRPDAAVRPIEVDFAPRPDSPGVFEASLALMEPGTWTLTAEVGGETTTAQVQVVPSGAPEDRARPDPGRAERLSSALAARGGAVVASDRAADLVNIFGDQEVVRRTETLYPARHVVWAFVLPLLLCAEIFLRRRYGVD
jgi:hypothetical protein